MIKREPKPKTIIPCIVLFILSILVFCFMAAPMYSRDKHDGRDNSTSYNFYEFFTVLNKDNVGAPDYIYDGKATISNIDYLKKAADVYAKELKEAKADVEPDNELILELEVVYADFNNDIRLYNIALSLFVINTLLLVVSLLGICLAPFNDVAALALKYTSFAFAIIVFLTVIVASGFISAYSNIMMEYAYTSDSLVSYHNISPALILSFVLFGLIGAGSLEGFAFIKQKKNKTDDTVTTSGEAIIEDDKDVPEETEEIAVPNDEVVDHGVIHESEDTLDDVKPIKLD